MAKKLRLLLIAVLILTGCLYLRLAYYHRPKLSPVNPLPNQTPTPTANPPNRILTKAIKVIDGDTIVIEGGQHVRYIGIDAPEIRRDKQPAECFGPEAAAKNRELVENKVVVLEKDVSDKDKYGRLLRYVWLDDFFVNEQLVKEGFAKILTIPPDLKYKSLFNTAQTFAAQNKYGVWNDVCD